MVSFIYSVYDTFGSGITVPGYGFVLNNRGALFSLDPKSPNIIAPHKRPFHTLLPGFLMKDGQPVMAFGLMGGSQQAQGHAQVLVDMIDLGANPQAASDAARFTHAQESNTLDLESSLYDLVGAHAGRNGPQGKVSQWRRHGRLPVNLVHTDSVYVSHRDTDARPGPTHSRPIPRRLRPPQRRPSRRLVTASRERNALIVQQAQVCIVGPWLLRKIATSSACGLTCHHRKPANSVRS